MNTWVDIHCHILPEVDDGSESILQTRNMLKIAHNEGIQHIIATPHYKVGYANADPVELNAKLQLVREEAKAVDEDIQVHLGNELFYSNDIIEHLKEKKALTIGDTRYVLVEFPVSESYNTIRAALHNLLINGYLPVLAHIERYKCLYQNYEDIHELLELGVYMQMNMSSIQGNITNGRTRFCRKLIEKGYVHFLSTDSHSDGMRAPRMREGAEIIRKKFGDEVLNQLLKENGLKMLSNQYI